MILYFLKPKILMNEYNSKYKHISFILRCLQPIAPWLLTEPSNFPGYLSNDTYPVSNHSEIAHDRVFSSSYCVSICFLRFRSADIILILHCLLVVSGHQIIWSLVSDCPHRQLLSWFSHFHFSNVYTIGKRSLQIFTSMTSLSILCNPRFRHFHAISFTVMLFHLYFCCRYRIYFGFEYALMSCWCTLLVIGMLLISNTVGDDGYMWVIGLYVPSSSW